MFAKDVCAMLTGPPVVISLPLPAPALTPLMLAAVGAALGLLGVARAQRKQ